MHEATASEIRKKRAEVYPTCPVEEELLVKDHGEEMGGDQSWRIFKIMAEFVKGFELVSRYKLAATVFGSARCGSDDKCYRDAELLGNKLAKAGFTIITGGAAGVMEAANRGAYKAGGHSVGLNIKLPEEQKGNDYTTDAEEFHYFFTRKIMLSFASEVYIFMPGGFGTLDEFFEIVTLIQTKKIASIPVVLVGREYWEPLLDWFEDTLLAKYGTISPEDKKIFHLVDSVDEAYDQVLTLVEACHPKRGKKN